MIPPPNCHPWKPVPRDIVPAPQRVPVVLPDQVNRSISAGRHHRVGREDPLQRNPASKTAARRVAHQPVGILSVPRGDPRGSAGVHGDGRNPLDDAPAILPAQPCRRVRVVRIGPDRVVVVPRRDERVAVQILRRRRIAREQAAGVGKCRRSIRRKLDRAHRVAKHGVRKHVVHRRCELGVGGGVNLRGCAAARKVDRKHRVRRRGIRTRIRQLTRVQQEERKRIRRRLRRVIRRHIQRKGDGAAECHRLQPFAVEGIGRQHQRARPQGAAETALCINSPGDRVGREIGDGGDIVLVRDAAIIVEIDVPAGARQSRGVDDHAVNLVGVQ